MIVIIYYIFFSSFLNAAYHNSEICEKPTNIPRKICRETSLSQSLPEFSMHHTTQSIDKATQAQQAFIDAVRKQDKKRLSHLQTEFRTLMRQSSSLPELPQTEAFLKEKGEQLNLCLKQADEFLKEGDYGVDHAKDFNENWKNFHTAAYLFLAASTSQTFPSIDALEKAKMAYGKIFFLLKESEFILKKEDLKFYKSQLSALEKDIIKAYYAILHSIIEKITNESVEDCAQKVEKISYILRKKNTFIYQVSVANQELDKHFLTIFYALCKKYDEFVENNLCHINDGIVTQIITKILILLEEIINSITSVALKSELSTEYNRSLEKTIKNSIEKKEIMTQKYFQPKDTVALSENPVKKDGLLQFFIALSKFNTQDPELKEIITIFLREFYGLPLTKSIFQEILSIMPAKISKMHNDNHDTLMGILDYLRYKYHQTEDWKAEKTSFLQMEILFQHCGNM